MRLIPGDACVAILSDGEASYTQEELQDCRVELNLDNPLVIQYFDWIGGAVQGDFGDSLWFKAPVMEELGERIPVTNRTGQMQQYALKRIALFFPTILLVTIIIFVVMRLIPGDACIAILSDGEASYTQEELQDCRVELNLDNPLVIQYFDWIGGAVQGDFGDSLWFKAPVMEELAERIPVTVEMTILAMLIAVVFAVPLGIVSALKPESWIDYAARIFTVAGISMPTFLVAILIILFLSRVFGWLPELGYQPIWDDPGANLQQMIFPALALALYEMAFIARVTRQSWSSACV